MPAVDPDWKTAQVLVCGHPPTAGDLLTTPSDVVLLSLETPSLARSLTSIALLALASKHYEKSSERDEAD
jgi:hypothetical protein